MVLVQLCFFDPHPMIGHRRQHYCVLTSSFANTSFYALQLSQRRIIALHSSGIRTTRWV